jgi:HAE1 family hydrophobic/amphiphilic exporter-1
MGKHIERLYPARHNVLGEGKLRIPAAEGAFRPIVMTSFAFIMGVVPLLIAFGAGAASRQAIGTVVFGGMLASTLLAIPFVPVFYVIMERLSERLRKPEPATQKEDRSRSLQ